MERRFGQRVDQIYFGHLLPALSRLPVRLGYRCVAGLSPLVLARNRGNAESALAALESCTGNGVRFPAANRLIVRRLFRSLLWEDFDVFHRRRWNADNWEEWFEIRGAENLEAPAGAILMTAHIGSLGIGLMALGVRGYPITHVSRDFHRESGIPSAYHRYALAKIRTLEEALGRTMIFADARDRSRASQSVLNVSRALAGGQLISMAIDLTDDRLAETLECHLLGAPARLGSSIVRLAKALSRPVIPYWILRHPQFPWRHIIEVNRPLAVGDDLASAQQRCAAALEEIVLRRPEQWLTWDSLVRFRQASDELS